MKAKDVFRISGVVSTLSGPSVYYGTDDNCKITKIVILDDEIGVSLKGESGLLECTSTIRIQEKYKDDEEKLFKLFIENDSIIGLTLAELRELNINIDSLIKK